MNELTELYEEIRENPLYLIQDMTFDEFCDWLDLGSKQDLEAALEVFEEKEVDEMYTRTIRYKLNKIK